MGDYKQLNRELIDANRELKQTIAIYQKELVLMRSELMEQQRLRVEQQQEWRERVISMLSNNFVANVREIDANANIPEILGYCNSTSTANYAAGVSGKSDSGHRSSQLVREFRRSSTMCRQNNIRMSPTRRPQEDNAIAEQTEYSKLDEASDSDMDVENLTDEDEEHVIDIENDENVENEDLHCIREADEEEESEDDESNAVTLAERQKRKPIRDLTNVALNELSGGKGNFVTKRGRQRDRCNDKEDSIEAVRDFGHDYRQSIYHPCDIEVEDDLVNTMRKSLNFSRDDCEESAANIAEAYELNNENKDQFKRQLVVRVQRLHEAPQTVEHLQTADLSLGITQFSMGNFLEASCSTPCHNTKTKTSTDVVTEKIAETNSLSSTQSQTQAMNQSMRPPRKCAPKNLVEPNLRTKQRSEIGRSRPRKH